MAGMQGGTALGPGKIAVGAGMKGRKIPATNDNPSTKATQPGSSQDSTPQKGIKSGKKGPGSKGEKKGKGKGKGQKSKGPDNSPQDNPQSNAPPGSNYMGKRYNSQFPAGFPTERESEGTKRGKAGSATSLAKRKKGKTKQKSPPQGQNIARKERRERKERKKKRNTFLQKPMPRSRFGTVGKGLVCPTLGWATEAFSLHGDRPLTKTPKPLNPNYTPKTPHGEKLEKSSQLECIHFSILPRITGKTSQGRKLRPRKRNFLL